MGKSEYEKIREDTNFVLHMDYHGRMLQEICKKLGIEHYNLWHECCKFHNGDRKENEQ